MTVHLEQTASVLQRAIQATITRGLNDPRIRGMITITNVDVAPDLAHATVYVSISPEKQGVLTLRGLQHASRHIRHLIGDHVQLRKLPQLHFRLDKSLKKQAAVLHAINEAIRNDRKRNTQSEPNSETEDTLREEHENM